VAKLRSRKIESYFAASFDGLRDDTKLLVDVHLYFSSNRHILIWRKRGEKLSEKLLAKYRKRGLQTIWIHVEDRKLWERYLQDNSAPKNKDQAPQTDGSSHTADLNEMLAQTELTPETPRAKPRTEEGNAILDLLLNPELDPRHKVAHTARAARNLLAETVKATEHEVRKDAMAHAREAVRDILDNTLDSQAQHIRKAINEVWDLSKIDPDLDHSANVATFAVLFGLAFGRISPEVLADIALAALLHDVGLTQVSARVVQTPTLQRRGRDLQIYSRHVDEGLRLLEEFAGNLSPRVKPLIQQHHEKFDGSGYPMQLQGFQVNDIAQLIAMADTLEAMASGQWDGYERSLMETFERLEKLEKSRNFPEFFNPEVFSAVTRWIREPSSSTHKVVASDIVRSTTRELIKGKA
jgi:HD-GYP domain-containing protein (c-di-GMP phosphodiesterase class II)